MPHNSGEQFPADAIGPRPSIARHGGARIQPVDDESVIGFEALWESMMKCKRGVAWKDSVAAFILDAIRETSRLCDQLHDGTYRERPHKYFTIRYPKERAIMSISFRDRVYQRSLNDVAIYPAMARGFIYDNAACQKGKGADFARNRLKCHLQRYYRRYGCAGWALKMDVRGYYPNMRHSVAKVTFQRRLAPNVYARAAAILDSFPGDVGFNPGSQIIQIAGISVLDQIDHYVKERLRVRHYLRYMDDMLVLSPDRAELERIREDIAARLAEIGFDLHPKKTAITPIADGIMFLGFLYRLRPGGRVTLTLDPRRVKAQRRKLRRMVAKARAGALSQEKCDQSYQCWRAHAAHGNSHNLIRRMDAYYDSLWRDAQC